MTQYEQDYEAVRQFLRDCQHESPYECQVRPGENTFICNACWNESCAMRKRADNAEHARRKAKTLSELAERGLRPGKYRMLVTNWIFGNEDSYDVELKVHKSGGYYLKIPSLNRKQNYAIAGRMIPR